MRRVVAFVDPKRQVSVRPDLFFHAPPFSCLRPPCMYKFAASRSPKFPPYFFRLENGFDSRPYKNVPGEPSTALFDEPFVQLPRFFRERKWFVVLPASACVAAYEAEIFQTVLAL